MVNQKDAGLYNILLVTVKFNATSETPPIYIVLGGIDYISNDIAPAITLIYTGTVYTF
jgi:hypothetical protein|nr:MAG TPA: hypothetical protein [Bacteriophage sp.]